MKDKAKSESPLIGEQKQFTIHELRAAYYAGVNKLGFDEWHKKFQEMYAPLKSSALIGERSAEEILHDHFKRVCTPINNRAPLETQLTLVLQAALQAMEEYASQFRKAKEESLPEAIDDGLCNNLLGWLNERVKLASYEQGYVLFALRQANNNGYQEAKKVESKEDNKAFGEWISVEERKPEIGEDGESEDVLCLGFKCSREDTETYEIMRWVKLTKPDMLDYKGKPIEYGWSNRWWDTNPDGVDVHYWKPLSSPGPIKWK